jgi:hypothetical protein
LINQSFSIMDKRKDNGGKRDKAGRKPKAEEQKLIEKLSPLMPSAYKALKNALADDESWAVKLAMEYFYGKPRQQMDITTDGDKININPISWVSSDED